MTCGGLLFFAILNNYNIMTYLGININPFQLTPRFLTYFLAASVYETFRVCNKKFNLGKYVYASTKNI